MSNTAPEPHHETTTDAAPGPVAAVRQPARGAGPVVETASMAAVRDELQRGRAAVLHAESAPPHTPQRTGPGHQSAAGEGALVDEVERRTRDPQFPYDPAAEWGDTTFREPRSDAEAAARQAHLDAHHPVSSSRPPVFSALEEQLVDAQIEAHYASRAHDGTYPAAAARVRELEAALQRREAERDQLEVGDLGDEDPDAPPRDSRPDQRDRDRERQQEQEQERARERERERAAQRERDDDEIGS